MLLSSFRNRCAGARDERGFTLLLALLVLTITTLLLGAAYFAVLNDTGLSRNDLDQTRAIAAAQAGIAQYTYNLNNNPNYWEGCPTATSVAVAAAASGSTERYSYQPVPATGQATCNALNPIGTMVETSGAAAGTFRIASTGTSNNVSRTVVAQYNRTSFLNYVYFSNYEDEDPLWAVETGTQTRENTVPGLNCAVYAWVSGGRSNSCQGIYFGANDAVNGPFHSNDTVYVCTGNGGTTIFGGSSADQIETPSALTEYYPAGLGGGDCSGTLKVVGTANNSVGTLQPPPDNTQLLLLADGGVSTNVNNCFAGYGCEFNGPTTIVLDGPTSAGNPTNQMTVTNANFFSGTPTKVNYPSNGVVYINSTGACSYSYVPWATENQLYGGTTLDTNAGDTANAGCGDASVQAAPYTGGPNGTPYATPTACGNGTTSVSGVCPYTQSLTIGADKDVIIASSLTTTSATSGCSTGWATTTQGSAAPEASCPSGTAVLGLVANDMIRVFHPVSPGTRPSGDVEGQCPSGATNGPGSLINPVIDAAIFSVEHSFIVDNLDCGSPSHGLGLLNVNGTIAQNFRGRVSESAGVTGYGKDYWYDSRLATIEPPYFLDPVSASWEVARLTECGASAAACT